MFNGERVYKQEQGIEIGKMLYKQERRIKLITCCFIAVALVVAVTVVVVVITYHHNRVTEPIFVFINFFDSV